MKYLSSYHFVQNTIAKKCFLSLSLIFLLTDCAVSEKPHFILNDASLRVYQSGDRVSYAILDETVFNYAVSLVARDEFSPDTQNKLELLFEDQVVSGSASKPFLPQYYQQNLAGDLIIKAVGGSGEIFWLMNDDNTEANQILYPSDITTLSTGTSFSRKLRRCDEDKNCSDAGKYELLKLKLIDTETTETNYGFFEAYKLEISVEIELLDPEQAGSSKRYSFSGTQWIYPLIGIVKFAFDVKTPARISNSNLIAPLSNTNISIDDSFKLSN